MHTTTYKPVLRTISFLLFVYLSPFTLTVNAADSYLAELEAEANSTDVKEKPTAEPTWSHSKQRLSSSLKSGLSETAFENSLRDNYYGSFVFYDRLSDWNKQQVYKTYQESNDIEQIRNEIKKRMTK